MSTSLQQWQNRKVDAVLCIHFQGVRWSVRHVPNVHVGELVQCLPTRRGDALRVRAGSGQQPDTLALQLEPVHSHLHTSPQTGTPASSGRPTIPDAQRLQCSPPGAHVFRTPQTPPVARHKARKHSRNAGIAALAPGVDSIAIVLVLHVHLSPVRGRKGIGKSRRSWVNSSKG